jgi:hypothetical protein
MNDSRRSFLKKALAVGATAMPSLAQSTEAETLRDNIAIIAKAIFDGKKPEEIDSKILNAVIDKCASDESKNKRTDAWRGTRVFVPNAIAGYSEPVAIIIDPEQRTFAAYKDPVINRDRTVAITPEKRAGAYAEKYPSNHKYDDTIYKNAEFGVGKLNELQAQRYKQQQEKKNNQRQ